MRSTTSALASYLMYPKVFSDFVKTQDKYGPTASAADADLFLRPQGGRGGLPRSREGQDAGPPLPGPPRETNEGEVRVFFDLNGQPRTITVPDRLKVGEVKVRAKGGDAAMPSRSARRCRASSRRWASRSATGVRGRRRTAVDRSDEDGNRHPRRARRRRSPRSTVQARRPDRRQGPAGAVRVSLRFPRPSPRRWCGSRSR